MRIIGVDPGISRTGYGIIEKVGKEPNFLDCGTITTLVSSSFFSKLQKIYDDLASIINTWRPNVMAIEKTIYAKNAKTAIKLGEARGVALLVGAKCDLDIYEYSPKKVKVSVVGNGSASKAQVRFMITRILNLEEPPASLDASDALAIALCHSNQDEFQ
jgi:crossover junction endodeoxyribonuclease RuvC